MIRVEENSAINKIVREIYIPECLSDKNPIIAGGSILHLYLNLKDEGSELHRRMLSEYEKWGRKSVLQEHQITYAPDYVINAGGLILVHAEIHGWPMERALADAAGIFDTVTHVLNRAKVEGITTHEASDRIAEERIAQAAETQRLRIP